LGTDGIQDGKVFILKDGIRAKLENCKVNWQGLLNSPYLEEIQKASNEVPMDSDLGLMIRTVYAEMRGGDDNAKAIVAESIQNRFELSAGYEKADGTYKGIVERFYDVSKSTNAANDAFANPTNHIYKNPEATESWISSVSASIKAKAGESNVGKGVIFYNSSSPTYYDNNSKMEKIALDITPNGIQGLWKLK
jgi:hypothetical protein